jgi:hypothetical protein
MKLQNKSADNKMSRRKFIGSSAAFATIAFLPSGSYFSTNSKPNSKFGGVQIGVQSYSFRSMPNSPVDILGYLKEIGLNSVELMDPMEEFAGAPKYTGPAYGKEVQLTDQQKAEVVAAQAEFAKELRSWRSSVSMDRYKELRKMYNDAGVNINITRLGNPDWSDEEINYAFNVARAFGSKGIKWEISIPCAKRLAPFVDKNGLYGIMHNHNQPAEPGFSFEEHLSFSKNLMLNFDTGHYFGSTGKHPNEIIQKFHDRMVSVHLKDKTGPNFNPPGTNMAWGKGQTPIADILLLIKKNKWPITADIELEHPIPEGSNCVIEVKKCVEICKQILTA